MLKVEDPHFRRLLYDISSLSLKPEELEWLQRKRAGNLMEEKASELLNKANEDVEVAAKSHGSAVILDGWTAPRAIGVIGIIVVSFLASAVQSFIQCESSSTAETYYRKLKLAINVDTKLFICTDGAANMVKLGEKLFENHRLLPIQCVTHGFSLVCHYVCKAFDTELVSKMGGVISFFTRSPQRMHELRQAASNEEGLGFVSMCRTRFAFVVFSALRLIRLRVSAKEALDKITVSASEADKLDDEELLYSTRGKVYETLSSDSFFEDLELYVRLAYPVMVIMREFDTAAPMAGFVYWAFANIRDQVETFFRKIEQVFRSKKDSEED